ncbi:MAG TPA: glycosyltransferase [Candidatus Avichristensenella intestinipullorum]|uniref:Glycosyltransferase n=1 Tax=Candidatus Avichristensenella intestinipullorum TaxID=2840693 RepID=A0A9D0YXI3_9FIRM|nr:glycosyltransferase [Candidatus Avichristensenella intestinipullorum]
MITVSLCMIARDEEAVLGRCLQSVEGIAEEIIVVDTGSRDATREIARAHGAKVYDWAWRDDFAAARNEAFSHASMEYILWLDADDVMDEENRQKFLALKETLDPSIDMVMMRYHVAFAANGTPTLTFYRERLMRRSAGFRWQGRVHEAIVPAGHVIRCDIAVRHQKKGPGNPGRNLRIYERMLAEGETLEPRHRYYYGRELLSAGRLEEAQEQLTACIEDERTWVENRIGACRDLAGCLVRREKAQEALAVLVRSLAMGAPRAEICCDIGRIYFNRKEYRTAAFWYQAAMQCPPSEENGGFASPECRGFLPCLQLCVCYDRMGDHQEAEAYNEKAAAFKPDDAAVRFNRDYFRRLREQPAAARP